MNDIPGFDPTGSMALAPQPYPCLDAEYRERIAAYGTRETLPEGTLLYERGQRSVDFFVLLGGSVTVFDWDSRGVERTVVIHKAGSFTGELDLFDDRGILLTGRAGPDTEVIRVVRDDFRRMLATESDIGEFLTRSIILRRFGLVQRGFGGVMLVGHEVCPDLARIRQFLTRNGYPHRLFDAASSPCGIELIDRSGLCALDLPAVITGNGTVMMNPSTSELADALGFSGHADAQHIYDVAVVGAGPAGLASAVYASSEGLDTIVIEGLAPGGQAATSSKIENYLGFPSGVSGQALASRAQVQAIRFGARLSVSRVVKRLFRSDCGYVLELDDGREIRARSVVAASGARYRKLDVQRLGMFTGRGIHYAATAMEGADCKESEAVVIGGGNSAGQAAVYLSRIASHVHVLVRSEGLASSMSDYLVQRIAMSNRITVHVYSEVTTLSGEARLESVSWQNVRTGEMRSAAARNLFVMIGAAPNTEWLQGFLELDAKGFIPTGDLAGDDVRRGPFETRLPGLFAVGDVRSGSVKRVASSVGEGSVVVQAIHQFLRPEFAT